MHTQSLQQQGWERGGRQDEQLGCGEHAERGCSAVRSLLGNLQASICRGDSSSQAIHQHQHQEGAILPSMNPTLISANVPATRAPPDSKAGLCPCWGGQAAQPEPAIISGFIILHSGCGTKELLGVNKRSFRECFTPGAARAALAAAPAAAQSSRALGGTGGSHLSQKHRCHLSLTLANELCTGEQEAWLAGQGLGVLGFPVPWTQTVLGMLQGCPAPWLYRAITARAGARPPAALRANGDLQQQKDACKLNNSS